MKGFKILLKSIFLVITLLLLIGHNFGPSKNPDECESSFCVSETDTATDINELVGIEHLNNNLVIENTNLTNLDALQSLKTVNGYIKIVGNNELLNIDGLSNLTSISDGFYIINNDKLAQIHFESLSNLLRLNINGNDLLTSISFTGVMQISALSVESNGSLTALDGFNLVQSIDTISLFLLPELDSLTIFSQLTQFDELHLSTLPLNSLATFASVVNAGTIYIFFVNISNFTELSSLQSIEELHLGNLDYLDSFSGLENVFINRLILEQIPGVINLQGLNSETLIEFGAIDLVNLSNINALSGAQNLSTIKLINLNQLSGSLPFSEIDEPHIHIAINNLPLVHTLTLPEVFDLGSLYVTDMAMLDNISPIINSIVYNITIKNAPKLETLEAFNTVRSINYFLDISDNESMCTNLVDAFINQLEDKPEFIFNTGNKDC